MCPTDESPVGLFRGKSGSPRKAGAGHCPTLPTPEAAAPDDVVALEEIGHLEVSELR